MQASCTIHVLPPWTKVNIVHPFIQIEHFPFAHKGSQKIGEKNTKNNIYYISKGKVKNLLKKMNLLKTG